MSDDYGSDIGHDNGPSDGPNRALAQLDEELSAYVDGELSPEAAAQVDHLAADRSDVADRIEELRSATSELRELGRAAVAVAPDLRTRLHARIAERANESARGSRGQRVPSLAAARRRRRWLAPAAGALAAGLALYLAANVGDDDQTGGGGTGNTPQQVAEPIIVETREVPASEARDRELAGGELREPPPSELRPEPADLTPAPPTQLAVTPGGEASPGPGAELPLEVAGEQVEDVELAIALELDALADFELIDQLELLEALAALEEAEVRS